MTRPPPCPPPSSGRLPDQPTQAVQYPPSKTVDQVDEYYGTRVADPYRWLEQSDAPDAQAWVAAQDSVTRSYIAQLPGRDTIAALLGAMWNYARVSVPSREGGKLFFAKNSGLDRQSAYYMAEGHARDAAERGVLVLDPNAISPDGSTQLSLFVPDPTGTYVAYGLSPGGSDARTIKIRRLGSDVDLEDTIERVRYSGVSWTWDGRGFFYTRYAHEGGSGSDRLGSSAGSAQVCYHRVGTAQSTDTAVFDCPSGATWRAAAGVSADGRWLFVLVGRGTSLENCLYAADMGSAAAPNVEAELKVVDATLEALFWPVGAVGDQLFVVTNLGAPNYRVAAIGLAGPDREGWTTVVAEAEYPLLGATLVGDRLFAQYVEDVKSAVHIHTLAGTRVGTLPLPGAGVVGGLSGRQDGTELFFAFTSYLAPQTIYHYDVRTERMEAFFTPEVPFRAAEYETEQIFYTSKDGTRVPMSVTRRKGLVRDGSSPTMLEGYGGFNVSMLPSFTAATAAWLEMGGVYAVANVRGGGEYGGAWHDAGKRERRQNAFDDFAAAADWLVANRYTSAPKLAIGGHSNGALLAAAVITQRPDICAVALLSAGVLDMLRYHKFPPGDFWVAEYGSVDEPDQFEVLVRYSPLHNLARGKCYPATLTVVADRDDRVVPAHSFKWAAALQAAQGCDRPVLLRVDAKSGHDYRPVDRAIAERADVWTFAARHLGMTVRSPV